MVWYGSTYFTNMRPNTIITISALAAGATVIHGTSVGFCNRHTYSKFAAPFVDMAVFGDSFSDVGNIYNALNGTQPGVWSYDGRYSDGRVWEEYLLQFFDLPNKLMPSRQGGTNHAYGGATADNSYIDSFSTYLQDYVPSVRDQVTKYIDNEKGNLPSERLHVIYVGYNDYWWYVYRNYTTLDGQDMNFENVYTTVATSIVDQMDRLNVVNMSEWAEASLQTQDVLGSYDVLVSGHNRVLATLLSDFESRYNDAIVYQHDNFRAFECIHENKDWLGIKNVTDPCHPTQQDSCEPIFNFAFWDYYHPTARAHFIASTFALQAMYEREMERRPAAKHYDTSSGGIIFASAYFVVGVSILISALLASA